MLQSSPASMREAKTDVLTCDLAVAGGGLAGACCAITAARAGLKVVLVQDRPVLGGNASSEVRLWTLGATAHMGAPQRWAREGGVIDEILVENLWRNPEGNALLFDTVLLEKVISEPNLTLLLNTAVFEVEKSDADTLSGLRAFCSQNSTLYDIKAPLFVDASGDGIVGFLSGAAFRMGAEGRDEFGEKFAPTQEYGELLGHSIYFYSKDTGKPVTYVPPSFALADIEKNIPRYAMFNAKDYGCRLWWIEYGGRLDTVHDTEKIKWELWKVVYGVWDYIKNSGKFPEAQNMTLEWVGHVPGKRESRRFEGDLILRQQDVIEQKPHYDAVAFGGWALDLHPADGVFSEKPGCTHWRMRGIYQIPYRTMFSRNIKNLFLAGRIMSVTHAAYGSTRVMATLAHCGQAIGHAAELCRRHTILPRDLATLNRFPQLEIELLRSGQHIPQRPLRDPDDLAHKAKISASDVFQLEKLPSDGPLLPLDKPRGQMLPLQAGKVPQVTFWVDAKQKTTLELSLRASSRPDNHDFNDILAAQTISVAEGKNQPVVANFDVEMPDARYGLVCLAPNDAVSLHTSEQRVSGVLSLEFAYRQDPQAHGDAEGNKAVSAETWDVGVESFDVWLPSRRPEGRNFALEIAPPLAVFGPENLRNGWQRPTNAPNAFLVADGAKAATATFSWPAPQKIGRLELFFDTDYDHPAESVLWGHPERAVPFCLKHFRVWNGQTLVFEEKNNHQTRRTLVLEPLETAELKLELVESWGRAPRGLFEARIYES